MTDASLARVSEDTLLGGRVHLRQPSSGYRVAIDSMLLAAAVAARPGDNIADFGSGTGAASLCLAHRVPGCRVTGLELQPQLVALAVNSAADNDLEDRVRFVAGDVAFPPPAISSERFDYVMANPPHRRSHSGTRSPHPGRALADVEGEATLGHWLDSMVKVLRPQGRLTLIQRAERLSEVLCLLGDRVGDIAVFPLWPKAGVPAKRILVSARRGVRSPSRLEAGLTLHQADGSFTPAAQAILRDGQAIAL